MLQARIRELDPICFPTLVGLAIVQCNRVLRGWGILWLIPVHKAQHRHRLALSKPLRADHRVHLLQVGPGRAAELVTSKLT